MCSDTKSEHSSGTDDDSETCAQYQPLKNTGASPPRKKFLLKSVAAQGFVTCAVMLSSASCGMPVGYSAILLPQLKFANETAMQIDDEMGSWIASIHSAATPAGSLLSGLLMDRCGRKLALQIASLPLIVGWMLIGFAHNHTLLLLGRMVAGLSAGLTAAAGQVLIGEISEPHLRGMFSSVPFASYSLGILLVYALGSFLSWRYVAGLSTILPLLSITIFFFLPESPMWLVRNGKIDKARQGLTWLRGGNTHQARKETEHLMERVENDKKCEKHSKSSSSPSIIQILLRPEVLKPIIILNVFNLMQILSGTYIIVFYAVDILSHISGNIDHFMGAVVTACVRFGFSVVASVLLTLIGRRALAMTSGLGTAISALCLGTFLYPRDNCVSATNGDGYFAALCVLLYVATNTIGFMILPGVLLSELFPAKIRGLAGGLTFMLFNFLLFGVAKIFPFVKNTLGLHGVFWIFGGTSLLASVFLYVMLPETKNKSLSQIEDYFKQKNITWVGRKLKPTTNETEAA